VAVTRFFLVFAAGGLGSVLRYAIAVWSADRFGTAFPYGTLIVNISGCFLIAVAVQLAAASWWDADWHVAVTTGLIGGFTTYSAFNEQTIQLIQTGATGAAAINIAGTFVGGLAAGWLGLVVARQVFGT
jgi:CrcB protein